MTADFDMLCSAMIPAARRSMDIPNAGGASNLSEALSMQYMYENMGCTDFIPEMEVAYYIEYKMCDYMMKDAQTGENVGVSVTRAVSYPFSIEYTIERARDLLYRKLYGLIVAKDCVDDGFEFYKSILHIWCYSELAALMIEQAHAEITAQDMAGERTYDDVHVICTICPAVYIYTNRP
jgi:hypothetical protein